MTDFENAAAVAAAGMVARCDGRREAVRDLPWNASPVFPGVELKHLITGADTDGRTSLHLVRIAPGCVIGGHAHDPQWEVHEVLAGSGSCVMDGAEVDYAPGVMRVLPPCLEHEVRAGDRGLRLLAVFSPALL